MYFGFDSSLVVQKLKDSIWCMLSKQPANELKIVEFVANLTKVEYKTQISRLDWHGQERKTEVHLTLELQSFPVSIVGC